MAEALEHLTQREAETLKNPEKRRLRRTISM